MKSPSVLVVYASKYGQTQLIAMRIADVVDQEGGHAHVWDVATIPSSVDLREFDVVVLAGPVLWGRHPRSLRRFIARRIAILSAIPAILVSVSNAACSQEGREAAAEYAKRLFRESGWQAESFVMFGGGVPFSRYGFITRLIMKRIEREHGRGFDTSRDYDYTDWDAVDAFARSLVQKRFAVKPARGEEVVISDQQNDQSAEVRAR